MSSVKVFVFVIAVLCSSHLSAANLPAVTGIAIDGDVLSWEPQEGATGYNVYLDFRYYDTVRGSTSYMLSEPGDYYVVSFNDEGVFGITDYTADVEYTGSAQANGVEYDYQFRVLLVYNTCKNVGPGETCIATCPNEYQPPEPFGGPVFTNYLSGGACSTSDIVEADAFVTANTYRCTVPTFSGEVVAQGICVLF